MNAFSFQHYVYLIMFIEIHMVKKLTYFYILRVFD